MNIALTSELEAFVQTKVSAGNYASPNEVVLEALKFFQEHDMKRATELEQFQTELDRRLASLDRGEGLDGETVFAELFARAEERRRNRV